MMSLATDAIRYLPLETTDFTAIVDLGNAVHGDGYLDLASMEDIAKRSVYKGVNCSYVAYQNDRLVGFRLTYAAKNWQHDKWCTPSKWGRPTDQVCYFKCNTVDESVRGLGIGKALLTHSIAAAKAQGAVAGLAHIWLSSPGNSAFNYFKRCGGVEIMRHPDKWLEDSLNGYECVLCGIPCHCEAAEMLIDFTQPPYG